MEYDQWDTQFYWTRYHTEGHSRIPYNPDSFISPEFFSGFIVGLVDFERVLAARLKWALHYNMFDWELGRSFRVSRHLSIRPFMGIKGGYIEQRIYTHGQFAPNIEAGADGDAPFGLHYREHLKNDFWGVGPCGGVNTQWELARFHSNYLNVFGDFSVAGLWGSWEVSDRYRNEREIAMSTKLKDSHLGAWTLRGWMGLSWAVNFNKDRSRFTAKLGYEMQMWFNQLKLPTFQQLILHGDLTFQGGTLECRFDF